MRSRERLRHSFSVIGPAAIPEPRNHELLFAFLKSTHRLVTTKPKPAMGTGDNFTKMTPTCVPPNNYAARKRGDVLDKLYHRLFLWCAIAPERYSSARNWGADCLKVSASGTP